MSVSNLIHRISDHADLIKVAAVGTSGTGVSVFLRDFNQLMAGLAALATFVYVCVKIYQALRPPKEGG